MSASSPQKSYSTTSNKMQSQLSPSPFSNFQIFLGIFSFVVISSAILFLLTHFLHFGISFLSFWRNLEETRENCACFLPYVNRCPSRWSALEFFIHLFSSVLLVYLYHFPGFHIYVFSILE